MYRLKKSNIERVVLSEATCKELINQGFELVDTKEESSINESTEISKSLDEMTIDELKNYAEENGIDIGKATSHNGILEKIKEHEAE